MKYKSVIIFFILVQFNSSGRAQYVVGDLYGWSVFASNVGNVEFYPLESPLSVPVLSLYDKKPLLLKFDLLTTHEEQLVYRIELCNANWKPAELDEMEYIEGYSENTFYAFSSSYNTTVDYVQYQLSLPNDDVKFLKSGNYILHVYHEDEHVEILSRRFVVYEPLTELAIELDRFRIDEYSGLQPISVSISPGAIHYSDMAGNVELVVQQNGNWNAIKSTKDFNVNGDGNYVTKADESLTFDGMNEYRFFDIKSLKFISERVEYMEYKKPNFHIYLKPDRLRGDRQYFANVDLSGQYFIRNQESTDDDMLDADYVYVHFKLESEYPIASEVYVEGAVTNWAVDSNSMAFNAESGGYEQVLLLKQGIYNYRYVTKDFNSNIVYSDITEGNHYQTGNDYRAFLYYRAPGDYYDRVVGYGLLKTGKDVEEHDKDAELNIIQQLLKEVAPR